MKDLYVRRVYTDVNGISVTVEIDYVKKLVSFVEKDGKAKNWKFAERGPEYMNGWRMIFAAMDYAAAEVKKEFDAITEQEHEEFVAMYMELDKALKKDKLNAK